MRIAVLPLLGAAAVLTTLTGCPGPASCDPPENPETFEVGTGEDCFERVTADEAVPIMSGPQGGFHVWLAIGCGDCESSVRLRFKITNTDSGAEVTPDTELFVDLYGDEWTQSPGLQAQIFNESNFELGDHLHFDVRVFDAETGNTLLHEGSMDIVAGSYQEWNG
ncbi:MAG: hypothetical protein U0271_20375 [Polyangiaceae bacterium]